MAIAAIRQNWRPQPNIPASIPKPVQQHAYSTHDHQCAAAQQMQPPAGRNLLVSWLALLCTVCWYAAVRVVVEYHHVARLCWRWLCDSARKQVGQGTGTGMGTEEYLERVDATYGVAAGRSQLLSLMDHEILSFCLSVCVCVETPCLPGVRMRMCTCNPQLKSQQISLSLPPTCEARASNDGDYVERRRGNNCERGGATASEGRVSFRRKLVCQNHDQHVGVAISNCLVYIYMWRGLRLLVLCVEKAQDT